MSANAAAIIIACAAIGVALVLAFLLREKLQAFNERHNLIHYSDEAVQPISWNDGIDGVDPDGVPYYGRLNANAANPRKAANAARIPQRERLPKEGKVARDGRKRTAA